MSGMMPRKSKPASNNPGERLADWQGEKQTANPLVGHVQASGSPSNSSSEQENNQSFVSDNSMMMAMSDAEDLRRERENNTKVYILYDFLYRPKMFLLSSTLFFLI